MKKSGYCLVTLLVLLSIDTVQSLSIPPRFEQNIYAFIPEDLANGSLIKSFNVTDSDHDNINLGIFDESTRSTVFLNETNHTPGFVTGNVYLINPENFDFDRVTGFVHVILSDVNDNAPVFKRPAYIYEIAENTSYPTTHDASISATDADDGVNKNFKFKLNATGQSPELYEGVFTINPNNGILTLTEPLDYETLSFYQYTISAVDSGTPSLTGTADITIKVTDVQDTPPIFQGLPYLYTITENSSWAGEDILAQDGDRGIPREIKYNLIDSVCSELFELHNTSGKLLLKDKLDRDSGILLKGQGVCRFDVKAAEIVIDGPMTNSTTTTTVTVTVEDIDDNVPTFNKSSYDAYVQENVSSIPMTIVGSIGIDVFDLDQGSNSEFSLIVRYANGTDFDGIVASPHRVISRASFLPRLVQGFEFDYETEQKIELHVVAMGTVNSSMSSTCTVTVYINNTNDNDPEFNQTDYSATIPEHSENGTPVTTITATDNDCGEYGELTYTLKGSSLFSIGKQNGTVYTVGDGNDLDRETRDTYYLTVVATDGGNKRTVVSLTVTLSDINDNHPIFSYDTVEMSINENTIQFTPNIQIKATDRDETNTSNSEVRYRLYVPDTNLKNNFTVNKTTGELIAIHPLDYENISFPSENGQIHLIVIAYDLGTPEQKANITVLINVHDENDNEPQFLQKSYNASIAENSVQGKVVTTVSATDNDATSPNNITRYYIEKGGSDRFRMNGVNGTITVDLNAEFDRETQDLYNLTVIAADIGTPPHTGTVTVYVTITDINDECPRFDDTNYRTEVKENITIGTIVKTCNASDLDEDNNLKYSIADVSATNASGSNVNESLVKNMLGIHISNGSVYVSKGLNRETANQIVLDILVNDTMCAEHCPQISEALLTIDIEDVNDVAPTFSPPSYQVDIEESAAIDSLVVTVSVSDLDTVGLGPFFTLVDNPYSKFKIRNTNSGEITTNDTLDRETHSELNVTVRAFDGVNNSTALVTINVLDVNDNAPAFLPYDDTVNITEGNYTDSHIPITTVNATDADEGINAVIRYRLEDTFDNSFWINETTGDIFAIGDIDRDENTEHGTKEFELTVIAENSEAHPSNLQNTTTLIIRVLDVNDNHPTFVNTPYRPSKPETKIKNGTYIFHVSATDPDNGFNGTEGVTYGVSGTTNGTIHFHINESGYIYANNDMTNKVGVFILNVIARDGGNPPLVSSVEVFITVEDENNNAPIFNFTQTTDTVFFSMLECMENGSVLAKIHATDADKGMNGEIAFSFVKEIGLDPGPFHINSTTGLITLVGKINSTEQSEYVVRINATDHGTPTPLTTRSKPVRILIKDVNDKPPVFKHPEKWASVMENTINVKVTRVEAKDEDADSVTNYFLKPVGDYFKHFHVNKTTGVVTIVEPLDRENTSSVLIHVEARDVSLRNETCNNTDGNTVPINATLILNVTLDDKNDNPPVFTSRIFDTGIRKNVKIFSTIFDFVDKVTDKDSEIHSVHSFKILGDIEMPKSIKAAVESRTLQKCKNPNSEQDTAVCLTSNGTVTTNMVFEENMSGTMKFRVQAMDEAGNDTAILKIDIIVDNQMAKMIFALSKQEVENFKFRVTEELSNLTGYTFVPDEVDAYTKSDGTMDVSKSILTFYVKEPSTGRILSAKEITNLVDRFGSSLTEARRRYLLVSIEEAFQAPVKTVDERFKQTMILAGATVLEALIICILIVVACRSQGKFKRKLKAATVTTKDEKDTSEKKKTIVPGSNVYASITNPILNKDVPLTDLNEIDNMSDTDSQNSLDSNEVGTEGLTPNYHTTEEKEAVMDMYTEDYYQPDRDMDPLQMALSMHEMEKRDQNGYNTQIEDDGNSDFQFDFDNPVLQLETTEV